MNVIWNQSSGKTPVVYFDTLDHGQDTAAYAFKHRPDMIKWVKRMHNHSARLKGLKPNTVYYFVVADSKEISSRYSFKTLPDNQGERLSIIAGGDSRNHRKYRQKANRLVAKLRPHFVMFGGDMTGSDNSTPWKQWFDDWQLSIGEDGRITPIVVARGNHEKSNRHVYYLFDTPNKEVYYAMTLAGGLARIYTLNTLISISGKQRDWLAEDLAEQKDSVRWKLAQYHHPIRPHTRRKSEGNNGYRYWANLFHEFRVDLVVECDAHVAKTTYPIIPSKDAGHDEGFIRNDKEGTVYVGEGCWGAPLRANNDNKKWTRASGSFNQFKWIWIDRYSMEVRTVKTTTQTDVGVLTDSTRFHLPEGIDIWKPETGDVILMEKSKPKRRMPKQISEPRIRIGDATPAIKKKTSRGWMWGLMLFTPIGIWLYFQFRGETIS